VKQEKKVKCQVCGELRDGSKIAIFTVDVAKEMGTTHPEYKHIRYCIDKGCCINGAISIGEK